MSMSSVLIISLAAGVVLVVGGGLLMYMANLVKNAYEIKVQINADLEERLKSISDDLDKKSKWIKRDMLEEFEKTRSSLITDNTRRLQELIEPFGKRLEAIEQRLQIERTDWSKAVDDTKTSGVALDAKISQIRKDIRRVEEKLGLEPSSPVPARAAPLSGVPGQPGAPAQATAAKPQTQPGAQPAPKPESPKGPQSVTSILQELG